MGLLHVGDHRNKAKKGNKNKILDLKIPTSDPEVSKTIWFITNHQRKFVEYGLSKRERRLHRDTHDPFVNLKSDKTSEGFKNEKRSEKVLKRPPQMTEVVGPYTPTEFR